MKHVDFSFVYQLWTLIYVQTVFDRMSPVQITGKLSSHWFNWQYVDWIIAQSLQFNTKLLRSQKMVRMVRNREWKKKQNEKSSRYWLLVAFNKVNSIHSFRFSWILVWIVFNFDFVVLPPFSSSFKLIICLWWCAYIGIVCGNAKHRLTIYTICWL